MLTLSGHLELTQQPITGVGEMEETVLGVNYLLILFLFFFTINQTISDWINHLLLIKQVINYIYASCLQSDISTYFQRQKDL